MGRRWLPDGSEHAEGSSDRVRLVLRAATAVTLAIAATRPVRLVAEAVLTAKPFALVGLVVLGGWCLARAGVFERVGTLVSDGRMPVGLSVAALLAWTAALSGLANLDVAVVVAVPLAITLASRRGISTGLVVIAVANIANAASFLLPTSNVTNLLVLSGDPLGVRPYVHATLIAWLAVVSVTTVAFLILLGRHAETSSSRVAEARWSVVEVAIDLATMFLLATALRSLLPTGIRLPGDFATQAVAGSAFASVVNNLPAAAAVAPSLGAGRWAAILAMSAGTNLLVTGSVATVIARRIARGAGSDLQTVRFATLGLLLLPVQLGVAWVGFRLVGA